jgi:hypothetical protein
MAVQEMQVFGFKESMTCVSCAAGKYKNGTGTAACFNMPTGVAVDWTGAVIVADTGNHAVRRVTVGGVVTTLAGNIRYGYFDGFNATLLRRPTCN